MLPDGESARTAPRVRLAGVLAWTALLHLWNDGLTAGLTALLPFIARDLRLDYAHAALVRTVHLAALSGAQIPLAALAARMGSGAILGGGLVWFGAAIALLGTAATFPLAFLWAAVAGVGAGAFHPVGTHQVSEAVEGRARGRAMGTLNFSGDVGKFAVPAAAGMVAALSGWRDSLAVFGGLGALSGVLSLWAHRRGPGAPSAPREISRAQAGPSVPGADGPRTLRWWGIRRMRPFTIITAIGIVDQTIRSAAVTFLPFLLVARGFGTAEVGGLFALIIVGGAIGKLACGWITDLTGERPVIIATELLMAAGLAGVLRVGGGAALAAYLVALGAVLNGTSSAFNTGLAAFLDRSRGSRGYGLYYTCTFAGSALAPAFAGALADRSGLAAVFVALALAALLIPPMAAFLPAGDSD